MNLTYQKYLLSFLEEKISYKIVIVMTIYFYTGYMYFWGETSAIVNVWIHPGKNEKCKIVIH
jgi:hypothetical protein